MGRDAKTDVRRPKTENLRPSVYRFSLPVLFLLSLLARTSAAQVADDFADGDFTSAPAWTGTTERWTVAPVDGNPVLRSRGLAEADTIYLATPSGVSSGTWRFTFRYDDVNLSNFNGARVFLLSNTADLSGEVFGYYVQLGASNSDEVRLYRLDGDPDEGRAELGSSAAPLLEGESGALDVEVTRSPEGAWSVRVDGAEVLTAEDNTYTAAPFFGVWVKHSGSAPQAYAFDDIVVTGEQGPADTTPPQVAEGRYTATDPAFILRFSEPLDASTVTPSAFTISGGVGNPASAAVQEGDATRVRLGLSAPLATGAYEIDVAGIADLAGNAIRDTTFTIEVDDDTEAPMLAGARALSAQRVEVSFSKPMVNGCAPERYAISDVGPPSSVNCPDGEPSATYQLDLASPLSQGITYTLTVRGVEDKAGNRLDEATTDFTFTGAATSPAPGEIVINEILYDPIADAQDDEPDQPEYVELYNTTDRALSLGGLLLAEPPDEDGDVAATSLPEPDVLPPGGYALVFDEDGSNDPDDPTAELRLAFPDRDFDRADVVLVPVSSVTPRGLSNSGETLRLLAPDLTELDVVDYLPEWHTAAVLDVADVDGRSLERVDPLGPSDSAANWGTSVAEEGGTPGARNSIMLEPGEPPSQGGLTFEPSPFNPADGPVQILYTLSETAALARVRIFDAKGRLVRTLEEAVLAGLGGRLVWDGLDDTGQALRVGIYVVLFEAVSTEGGVAEAFKEAVVLGRPLN